MRKLNERELDTLHKEYKKFKNIFLTQSGIDIEKSPVYYIRNTKVNLDKFFDMELTLTQEFNCNCGKNYKITFLNGKHYLSEKDKIMKQIKNPGSVSNLKNITVKTNFEKIDYSYPKCFDSILKEDIVPHPGMKNIYVKHGFPTTLHPKTSSKVYLTTEKFKMDKYYEICKVMLDINKLHEQYTCFQFIIDEIYLYKNRIQFTDKIKDNIIEYINNIKANSNAIDIWFNYNIKIEKLALSTKVSKNNSINKYWNKFYASEEEALAEIELTKEKHNIIDCVRKISQTKQRKESPELSTTNLFGPTFHISIDDKIEHVFTK